jgi:hypothetical protein
VIILLSNYEIIKLDKDFQIKWKKTDKIISEELKDKALSEVVIKIIPYKIHVQDEGMIVIGMKIKSDSSEHFSYFALTGK